MKIIELKKIKKITYKYLKKNLDDNELNEYIKIYKNKGEKFLIKYLERKTKIKKNYNFIKKKEFDNNVILKLVNNQINNWKNTTYNLNNLKLKHEKYILEINNEVKLFSDHSRTQETLNFFRKVKLKYPNLHGKFVINLGDCEFDSYPYPVLAFSKSKNSNAILIPNYYLMNGDVKNCINEVFKLNMIPNKNNIYFRGINTGRSNDRLKLCIYSIKKPFMDCKISPKIINKDKIDKKDLSKLDRILDSNFIKKKLQLDNKYLLSMDGNGTSYDRFIWILFSNSLCLKFDSDLIEFFYSDLKPFEHYVPININNIDYTYKWIQENPTKVQQIIKNSTDFISNIINQDYLFDYTFNLLNDLKK